MLYDVSLRSVPVLLCAAVAATVVLAAAGTVYGVLATGSRARDTLVPLLVLPAVTPVMLGASRAFAAGLDGTTSDAWQWVQLPAMLMESGAPQLGHALSLVSRVRAEAPRMRVQYSV